MTNPILRCVLAAALLACGIEGMAHRLLDADTKTALPLASITDCHGNVVAMTKQNGDIPAIVPNAYPITFNYMGYEPLTVSAAVNADVEMTPRTYGLSEIVITPTARPLLYVTGYMREVASALGSTDSVTILRESLVDVLVPVAKTKVKGWSTPRQMAAATYVRMANAAGLDSVSNKHMLSPLLWGQRHNLLPKVDALPASIKGNVATATDTVQGKYGPKEIWTRHNGVVHGYYDALADEKNHTLSPWILKAFGMTTDFTDFSINSVFNTSNTANLRPEDMTQKSMSFTMIAKGKILKKELKTDAPTEIKTYVEVYITDRRYLTEEEGADLSKQHPTSSPNNIQAPENATPLHPALAKIKSRVNASTKM